MHYGTIKKHDIANGTGIRVSLFVSGCSHHCPGCFNEETWDFSYGQPYTPETEEELLTALAPDYIAGLSVLGGEPFEKPNQQALLPLFRSIKKQFPQKNIWVYTGFLLDREILHWENAADPVTWHNGPLKDVYCDVTDELLSCTDVLVDGEFIKEKKSLMLRFRGSENQRIIDVPASLRAREVHLLELQ